MQQDVLIVHTYNDIVAHQYRTDGYLQTQPILSKAGKRLQDYCLDGEAVAFMQRLADEVQVDIENIVYERQDSVPGYYIHPRAAIHLAQWCNADLAVVVSSWIINWFTSSTPKVTQTTPEVFITPRELRHYTTLTKDLALTISCITNAATDAKTFKPGRFRKASIDILTNLLDISSELTSALSIYTLKTYTRSEDKNDKDSNTSTVVPDVISIPLSNDKEEQSIKVKVDTVTCNITSNPLLWKESVNTKPLTAKPGVISVSHRKTKSRDTIKNPNEPVSVTDRAYALYEQGIVSRLMTPMEIRNVSKRAAGNYRETLQREPHKIKSKNTLGYKPEELKDYLDPFILEVVGSNT